MSLADVMQPAIKHASRGYAATPYLHECITDSAREMLQDKPISAIYLPKGLPLQPGARVVQAEYAETLTYISQHGEAALSFRHPDVQLRQKLSHTAMMAVDDAERPESELTHASTELADGFHRAMEVDGGHSHQPVRMAANEGGHLVVGDQRPLRPPPGADEPETHPRRVHRTDRRLERDLRVRQAAVRPAAQRVEHRVGEKRLRRVLHPRIDDTLFHYAGFSRIVVLTQRLAHPQRAGAR